jgi:hypothetical protein
MTKLPTLRLHSFFLKNLRSSFKLDKKNQHSLVEIVFIFTNNARREATLGPLDTLELIVDLSVRVLAELEQVPRGVIAEAVRVYNVILGHVLAEQHLIDRLGARHPHGQLLAIGRKLVQLERLVKDAAHFAHLGHQTREILDKRRRVLQVQVVSLGDEEAPLLGHHSYLVAYLLARV